VDSIVDNHFIS